MIELIDLHWDDVIYLIKFTDGYYLYVRIQYVVLSFEFVS